MKVTFFYRQQHCAFSLEQVFADVRGALDPSLEQSEFYCPHRGASPRKMWENCQRALRHAGEVNHITGEVHYLAMALPRKGLVLTIHDTGDTNQFTGWKRHLFRWLWYEWPIRRASAVTFISRAAQQGVEKLVGGRIPHGRVIPDPVSSRLQFAPKPFPAQSPRILCLGTKPNKNIERMAQALRGLDAQLRIIGKLRPEQQQALEACGVRYSSAINLSAAEVAAEYQQADIVALVSTFEGFGLPIIEGQAVGRPVITSSLEPMADTAGQGALLVDPHDPEAIRTGLQRLFTDAALRRQLIEAGLVNVRRFQPEAIARQYEAVYHSALQ